MRFALLAVMPDKQIQLQIKIGKRLKQLRQEAGYKSYRAWADENSIEPKHLWILEAGKTDFKLSSLVKILDIHGITIQEFFQKLFFLPPFED